MQHLNIPGQQQRLTYHLVDQSQTPSPHLEGDRTSPKTPTEPRFIGRIFRDWWVELLAAILLIVDFSVLVAVLRAYQGAPLPKWPLGLSFNTALSVLGAIFRGPVLFIAAEGIGQLKWQWLSKQRPLSDLTVYDGATRGPWGSTKLLWMAKWRDLLALLAAFLTVASLGIDSFTQAVVSFHPCTTLTSAVPSISRINSFFTTGVFGAFNPTWVDRAIEASYDNPASILPDYTCPADFCNFTKPYHSVGICSKCFDVSDQVQTGCADDRTSCNYTLSIPGFPTENTTAGYTSEPAGGNAVLRRWRVLSVRGYLSKQTVNSSYITTLDIVSASPLFGCRCQLFYCIRSYTATIDHGTLTETLESISENWSSSTNETRVIGTVRVDCLKPQLKRYLLDMGYLSDDTDWMPWNGTYLNGSEAQDHSSDSSNLTILTGCVYQLYAGGSKGQWTTIEHFTDSLLNSVNGTTLRTLSVDDGPMTMENPSAVTLAGLYNRGELSIESLNHAFENFTTVVSNYMRTLNPSMPYNGVGDKISIPENLNVSQYHNGSYSTPSLIPLNPLSSSPEDWNQPITGQALEDTTCIHVRWPWLALPAAIFLGTLIFLAMFIAKTTIDSDRQVWKSSQNALIWHSLDGTAESESDTLVTKKEMDCRAKEIKVRLEKTTRGWKLVQDK
jgi:hypothetical protein